MKLLERTFEMLRSSFNDCVKHAIYTDGKPHFTWRVADNNLPVCAAVTDELRDFIAVLKNLKYAAAPLEGRRFSKDYLNSNEYVGYACAWGSGCDDWLESAIGNKP
jgi:hypothetical protein